MEHSQTIHEIEANYNSEDLKEIVYNNQFKEITDKTKFLITMVGVSKNVFSYVITRKQLYIGSDYIVITTHRSQCSKPIKKILSLRLLEDCKPY
jgi:hypothetical protein